MGYEEQERDGCGKSMGEGSVPRQWNKGRLGSGQKRSNIGDFEWQDRWFALNMVGVGRNCRRDTKWSDLCLRKNSSCWVESGMEILDGPWQDPDTDEA